MTRLQRIADYYQQIDANDLDAVSALFAEDAIYHRADRTYRGRTRIDRFFRKERLIRGQHAIEAVWQVPRHVITLGRFEGTGAIGDPRSVGFIDIWTFAGGGKVSERRTFLATGHAVVER